MARRRRSLLIAVAIVTSVTACGAPSADAPAPPPTFASGDSHQDAGALYIVSVRDPTLLRKVPLRAPDFSWPPGPIATWSPDGQQVAVTDEYGRVEIFDPRTGGDVGSSTAPSDAPAWTHRSVPGVSRRDETFPQVGSAPSPDGTMDARAVADESSNIELRISRVDGATIVTAPGQAPFAWSPDSRFVAAADFFDVVLVDTVTGASRTLIEAVGTSRSFDFGGLAWSPDGTRLAFTARETPGDD